LVAMAESSGLRVSFPGFVNQSRMPDMYALSDVLVLPSDAGETWGLVVNEAMASGRPVIVSHRAGCSADLVLPGITGVRYDAGNITDLRDALNMYLIDPRKTIEHGRAASGHIRNYGIPVVIEGIEQAVRSIRL